MEVLGFPFERRSRDLEKINRVSSVESDARRCAFTVRLVWTGIRVLPNDDYLDFT